MRKFQVIAVSIFKNHAFISNLMFNAIFAVSLESGEHRKIPLQRPMGIACDAHGREL